jgi:putative transposase
LGHPRTRAYDEEDLRAAGIEVQHAPPQSPNTQAFVERWIQLVRQECLHHFVVLGEKHLNYLVGQYIDHFHLERPHQGRDNGVPIAPKQPPSTKGRIAYKQRLGGLLKHYYRRAS